MARLLQSYESEVVGFPSQWRGALGNELLRVQARPDYRTRSLSVRKWEGIVMLMQLHKPIYGFVILVCLTLLLSAPAYPKDRQTDLAARLKQSQELQENSRYSAKEIAAAKRRLIQSGTAARTNLRIRGEYLLKFEESARSMAENAAAQGRMLFGVGDEDTLGEAALGTKVWIIAQDGQQLEIKEYLYRNPLLSPRVQPSLDHPKKYFVRKLPIMGVLVGEDVARIRYVAKSRSFDGRIVVDTTTVALRDDGTGGLVVSMSANTNPIQPVDGTIRWSPEVR